MQSRHECRSCAGANTVKFLSLGLSPLANALVAPDNFGETEDRFPLDVAFCRDCSLVQLEETVTPDRLFSHYHYFSSFSDTMLSHAAEMSRQIVRDRGLTDESLVVEIASNDGYLLKYYQDQGVPVLGIDPAVNVAEAAIDRGIPTLVEFFGSRVAKQLAGDGKMADVIHAHNVLAHVPALNDVVAGIATLLKPSGVAVIEVPYVRDLIENVEFDTIYHEHLCYFSLSALKILFIRHGLAVADVEHYDIHGGSLRLYLRHSDALPSRERPGGAAEGTSESPSVRELLRVEQAMGMLDESYYVKFSTQVNAVKNALVERLRRIKLAGGKIAAYGASAKGATLLNFCDIGADTLEYVVDRSTVKQGWLTPGTQLKIFAPDKLLETMPDYVLLLSWNFAQEIMDQQAEYIRRGGMFILPLSDEVIGARARVA